MGELANRLKSLSPERQKYLLEAMPDHLFKAGQTKRLRQLVCEREWFQAQRRQDPSDRSYAAGLELALQACQADPPQLSGLIAPLLISTTLNTLAGKVPIAVLESMTRDGMIEQARFLAEGHQDAADRCGALCNLALTAAGGGDHQTASELLESADQTALEIPDITQRLEGQLAVAGVAYQIGADRAQAVRRLKQIAGQISAIPDERQQTHLQSQVARIADYLGLPDQKQDAVQAIRSAYQNRHRLTPIDRRSLKVDALQAFTEARSETWDVAKFVRHFNLIDRPDDLLILAEWDYTRSSRILDRPGEMLAVLIREANQKKDLQRCQTLIERALSPQGGRIFTLGIENENAFIQVLGEIGQTDLAVRLIGEYLASDPDALHLREALARGAGVRGDLNAIELAAGPISAAPEKNADLGDRLWRIGEGIKHKLKRGLVNTLGRGDFERLQVYLSGYETLREHHPEKAGILWQRITEEGGSRWQRLAQEHIGEQSGESRQLRFIDRLGAVARWLPSGAEGMAELQSDAVDELVFVGNFERALEITNQIIDQNTRADALETIAAELIERAQIQAALEITSKIPNSVIRRRILDAAAEASSALQRSQGDRLATQITTYSRQLSEEELLTVSPAYPSLINRYLTSEHLGEALRLIEPLGKAALMSALPQLAAAAKKQEASSLADHLLRAASNAQPTQGNVHALAVTASLWATMGTGQDGWRERAAQAYRLAKKLHKNSPNLHRQPELPHLAKAAAALGDRSEMDNWRKLALEGYKNAKQILHFQAPPAFDQTLVVIVARQAGMGASTEQIYQDIQQIQNPYYRALAWAEVSVELEGLASRGGYRPKIGELVEMAGDYLIDKFIDKIDDILDASSTSGIESDSWQDEIDSQLGFRIEAALTNASRFLPHVLQQEELSTRLGSIGLMPGKTNEFKERPSRPELSLVKPLSRIIVLFGHHQRYEDVEKTVKATPYRSDLPGVVRTAVSVLIKADEIQRAGAILALLPNRVDKTIPQAILAAHANPESAPKRLIDCLDLPWNEEMLNSVVKAASQLQDQAASRQVADKILHRGHLQGRTDLLLGISALSRPGVDLLDENDWPMLVGEIINTETWW
jgi:hypothetical protein